MVRNLLSLSVSGSVGFTAASWPLSKELMLFMKDLKVTANREVANPTTVSGGEIRRRTELKCSWCMSCNEASCNSWGSARGFSDLLTDKCERVTCLGPLGLCGCKYSTGTAWDPAPSHKRVTGEVRWYLSKSDYLQIHRAKLFFSSLLALSFIFECHISLSSGAAYSWTVNELFLRPQEMKSLCEIIHSLNLKGYLIYC